MDEFGVLTERFGLKPQGKAAPMAASKRPINNDNAQNWNLGFDKDASPNSSSFFQSSGDKKTQNSGFSNDYDDIFGGPINSRKQSGGGSGGSSFDYDSFFSGSSVNSSSYNTYDNDDIFGGMPGLNSSTSANNGAKSDDIFGSFASPPKPNAPIDDLLGDFVGVGAKPKVSNGNTSGNAVNKPSGFDDLIPGFDARAPLNDGYVTFEYK